MRLCSEATLTYWENKNQPSCDGIENLWVNKASRNGFIICLTDWHMLSFLTILSTLCIHIHIDTYIHVTLAEYIISQTDFKV